MAITSGDRAPGYGTGSMLRPPTSSIFNKPRVTTTATPTNYPNSAIFGGGTSGTAPMSSGGAPGGETGGGFDGGGQSFGGGAASPPPAAPAPIPMKDVDWFASDGIYRGQSGRALTDLTAQLAQILADRDQGYRQLDNNRGQIDRGRQQDLTGLGDDFASRGLLGSGLFAQDADEVSADYARQGTALDQSANTLAQQYGKRDSMVNMGGINEGADLASIYGLLGAMGMGAGNNYNSALGKARAESASRATSPLVQTTNWG